MGVPGFFKWLTARYPKVVIDALTEDDIVLFEDVFRVGAAKIDPKMEGLDEEQQIAFLIEKNDRKRKLIAQKIYENNPKDIDNLYLDMNGLIHPCARPVKFGPSPQSEAEIFESICAYTDKLIKLTKPRKLIYIAIDGVAPRAKMN